jgi:hypothetical protein
MLGVLTRAAGVGLPWLAVLAISLSAAYGMTTGLAGAGSLLARGETPTLATESPVSIEPCDTTSARLVLYAVSNGWMPARFGGYCQAE